MQEANAARTAAEAAAEEAFLQLSEQRTHAEAVAVGAQGAEEEAAQARPRSKALPHTSRLTRTNPHLARRTAHPAPRTQSFTPTPYSTPTPPPAPPTPPTHPRRSAPVLTRYA